MLDGLYFPHILDTVLDHATPATLVAISQVCHRWRLCVKRLFHHLTLFEEEDRKLQPLLSLRLGRTFKARTLVSQASILLRHCQILDSEPPGYQCCANEAGVLDGALPSLTAVRVSDFWDVNDLPVAMRVSHYEIPPGIESGCPCCHWNAHHNKETGVPQTVKRFVLTTWGHDNTFDPRLPSEFESLAIIFLFDSAPEECYGDVEDLWNTFGAAVARAWDAKKPAIIINAESLYNHQSWTEELSGCGMEDRLRRKATESVFEQIEAFEYMEALEEAERHGGPEPDLESDIWDIFPPPGPVSPVHFITLDEYRGLVGDHQFAIDTQRGWVSEPSLTV